MYKAYGPYTAAQADQIEQTLREHSAKYERILDEQLQQQQMDEFEEPRSPRKYGHDFACVYFEIDDEDAFRIQKELRVFGIDPAHHLASAAPTPGAPEPYYCPRCDFEATGPGICPTHGKPLISDSEWLNRSNRKTSSLGKIAMAFFVAAVILGILGGYLLH